jgi:formamidopyrimidine-DNA glycosylase
MPELPEVETVCLGLGPVLRGQRFVRVVQRRKDLRFPLPERFAERLTGRRVKRLDRRAKYILVHLDKGEVLAVHLGMTGRFTVKLPARADPSFVVPSPLAREGQGGGDCRTPVVVGVPPSPNPSPQGRGELQPRSGRQSRSPGEQIQLGEYKYERGNVAKHDHLVFKMSNGAVVTYNDARRFGYMTLIPARELAQSSFFAGLGVEPLSEDLSPTYLGRRALGKKVDLKALLMDQRVVAGLGNIYVCEALFRAGLSPWKQAARLATRTGKPAPPAARLVPAIKAVLEDAIRAGGSTLRDYKQADGNIGNFQKEFAVYGRAGEPCARGGCRGTVRRKTQGGRSTFYCPVCQR